MRSTLHVFIIGSRSERVKNLDLKKVDEGVLSSKLDQLHVILHNFFLSREPIILAINYTKPRNSRLFKFE